MKYYPHLKTIYLINKGLENFKRKQRLEHFNLKSLHVLYTCHQLFEQHKTISAAQVLKHLKSVRIYMRHQEVSLNLRELEKNNYLSALTEKRRAFTCTCYKIQPALLIAVSDLEKQLRKTRI